MAHLLVTAHAAPSERAGFLVQESAGLPLRLPQASF